MLLNGFRVNDPSCIEHKDTLIRQLTKQFFPVTIQKDHGTWSIHAIVFFSRVEETAYSAVTDQKSQVF